MSLRPRYYQAAFANTTARLGLSRPEGQGMLLVLTAIMSGRALDPQVRYSLSFGDKSTRPIWTTMDPCFNLLSILAPLELARRDRDHLCLGSSPAILLALHQDRGHGTYCRLSHVRLLPCVHRSGPAGAKLGNHGPGNRPEGPFMLIAYWCPGTGLFREAHRVDNPHLVGWRNTKRK